MAKGTVTRLSPDEALRRWGSALQTKLPDGTMGYASFDDNHDNGFWYPLLDEEMKLLSYVLMEYP